MEEGCSGCSVPQIHVDLKTDPSQRCLDRGLVFLSDLKLLLLKGQLSGLVREVFWYIVKAVAQIGAKVVKPVHGL